MGIDSPLLFQDGFGTRWTALDAETSDAVDVLAFAPDLVESPDFAGAVGERVARLARVRHTLYARTRRLDRTSADTLLLFSDRVPGWRLADILTATEKEGLALDIGAILAMLRQLILALLAALAFAAPAQATRIKDLGTFPGVRPNQPSRSCG